MKIGLKSTDFSVGLILLAFLYALAGCGSNEVSDIYKGRFMESPVSGLSYAGKVFGTTDADGTFRYIADREVKFYIGGTEGLFLGSSKGAPVLTPLDLVPDAIDATDQRVTNRLILLQILDQDGDLNNGITVSEETASIVAAHADEIDFDQASTTSAFPASLTDLLTALNTAGVFTDTQRGKRRFLPYNDPSKIAIDAEVHFSRIGANRLTVTTTEGQLSGYEANATTWQWLGIRYAAPPVGDLRWKPPQDPEPWSGVRDAIAYGDQAPQPDNYAIYGEGNVSEDCLVLNVTAPKYASNLPVMVWFHGGAFGILSGNSALYNNPTALTTKEVVVVTVNHRLGAFGYLAHPWLTAESGYGGSGNYGQMDLIKALAWIHENIAAFGGNPDNVTIFGQSGGGGKAISLMSSPLAIGFFHKVICESGMTDSGGVLGASDLTTAEAMGINLSTRLAVNDLAEMRAIAWSDIVASDLAAYGDDSWLAYAPNVDHHYMTQSIAASITDPGGLPSDVPLLAGANSADMIADNNLAIGVAEQMPDRARNNDAPQYIYKWSYVPSGWAALGVGAYDGLELVYTFNYPESLSSQYLMGLTLMDEDPGTDGGQVTIDGFFDHPSGYGAIDIALTDTVMSIWTNFAKNSNPSVDGVITWPEYDPDTNDAYVEIESSASTPGYALTPKGGLAAGFYP